MVYNLLRRYACIPFLIAVLLATLAGCSQPQQTQPAAQSEPALVSPAAEPSETPLPTATTAPTPTPQLRVLGVGLQESQEGYLLGVQELVQQLAQERGWAYEAVPDLASLSDTAGVQVVVALSSDPGLAGFAAAHPELKFLVLGEPVIELADNIALVNLQSGSADQAGFLAGYISAVITQDWRVGVISQAETVVGKAARQGFVNGVVFYCGLCRPIYPPFYQYPVFTEIPAGAAPEAQQQAVDTMIGNGVKTVYVAPEVAEDPLLESLAQAGILLISGRAPSPTVSGMWVATIQADSSASIIDAWNRILAGEAGFKLNAALTLSDTNPQTLSSGRQRLVEEVLQELLGGLIDTGVDPTTGEIR